MVTYRTLVVTNLWPTESDPGYGSFVEAQMESLRALGVDFDVLFVDGRKSWWNYLRAVGEMRRRLRRNRSLPLGARGLIRALRRGTHRAGLGYHSFNAICKFDDPNVGHSSTIGLPQDRLALASLDDAGLCHRLVEYLCRVGARNQPATFRRGI